MKAPPLCSNFKAHTARARMSECGEAQRRRTQIQTGNAELNERDDMWLQTVNSNRNRNCNRSKRRKRNIILSPRDHLQTTAQQLHHHRWALNLVATGRQQQRLKKVPVFMYSHAPQALRLRRQAAAAIAKQQRRHEEELHLLTGKGAALRQQAGERVIAARQCCAGMQRRRLCCSRWPI